MGQYLANSYTNFDDLLTGVVNGVQGVLEEVAPQIETRLQASAVQNVHPMNDGEAGTITDPKNIRSSVSVDGNTVTMIVKDVAGPQASYITGDWSQWNAKSNDAAAGGTMFANWIEHGLWMDIGKWNQMGRPENNKPKRPKREFVSPVQVEAAMIVKTALHGL